MGFAVAAAVAWLKRPFKTADEKRLLAIEKAYDSAYYRAIACKRLIKKVTEQLHRQRSKDQTIEAILIQKQQEAAMLEYLNVSLKRAQDSIPQILIEKRAATARALEYASKNAHKHADALIEKSKKSVRLDYLDSLEKKIAEREDQAYLILDTSGELNPAFYHLPEQLIIAKEKEAAAMKAVLAQMPALDIDKLSDPEISAMLPSLESAIGQFKEVLDFIMVDINSLEASKERALEQASIWQERRRVSLEHGNTELVNQCTMRHKQFVDNANLLSEAKEKFEPLVQSIEEKIGRLRSVQKRIEERLTA